MKLWLKSMLSITLSLMCIFTCMGYAQFSNNVMINGSATVQKVEPQGLYISKVEVVSKNNAENLGKQILYPTNLKMSVAVDRANASMTYAITVHNKTDMSYWYLGVEYDGLAESNGKINQANGITILTKDTMSSSSSNFDTSDWIPPGTERTFYATYTFGSAAQGNISTLVNFNFGIHMGSVSDGFLKVLNDKISPYGYQYLIAAFNNQYEENGSTVIGNVGEDEEFFNNLLGSDLMVDFDGEEKPVTILIERKNVDGMDTGDSYSGNAGLSGCEYTLYLTVDDLSASGGQATVYAVSYTCGADGVWYQIGELYEGKSTVEVYENSNDPDDVAFDVDSWRAVKKTYTVISGVTYMVGAGVNEGQPFDRCTTITELMSIRGDTEFYNKVNNGSANLLKPVCKIVYSYQHVNGKYVESINSANRYKEGYDQLKAAFDRLKPNCFINNGGFERLENATKFSRAELVCILEDIQEAYDYYMAVNPNG